MKYYSEPMSASELRLERDELQSQHENALERIAYYQAELVRIREQTLELAVLIGYVQGKGLA